MGNSRAIGQPLIDGFCPAELGHPTLRYLHCFLHDFGHSIQRISIYVVVTIMFAYKSTTNVLARRS